MQADPAQALSCKIANLLHGKIQKPETIKKQIFRWFYSSVQLGSATDAFKMTQLDVQLKRHLNEVQREHLPNLQISSGNFVKIVKICQNCQKLSSKIVIKNCHQKLSSNIVIKNCHQKLTPKIVTKNCHQKLSSEIVTKN